MTFREMLASFSRRTRSTAAKKPTLNYREGDWVAVPLLAGGG